MEAPAERFRGGGVRRDKRPGSRLPRRLPGPAARSTPPFRNGARAPGGAGFTGAAQAAPPAAAAGGTVRRRQWCRGGRRWRWRGARGSQGTVQPPLVSPRRGSARPVRKPRRCCVTHPGQGGRRDAAARMPDYLGADQRKTKEEEKEDKPIRALDEGDIALLKTYGQSTYSRQIKQVEDDIQQLLKKINELTGIKESDTGLAPPALWDLAADKQTLQSEQPLQVARCTKIINADSEDPKYIINVKQFAKFVVDLSDQVAPTDIEEGMRVGVDRNKYQIHIPLPPKIDPTVTMMQVEEKPDVTYSDVGGCKEQIEKLREVVETPLLHPERFVNLGIEPPKGVLLFGPPGTGKTLCARAVANRTDACFIRVIGSELVQKYVGEGARMVRELFEMARTKKACLIFFDEIDAIGGARFDDGAGGDNEVQRTMLELINQLDGFDPRGNIKVLMATNRPDTLDPALMRPGRLDRKIEFSLPDLEGRTHIFKIHARSMSVERDIRFELLARLCPNSTGAEIRSVCTEAGMFAIRARRKIATEKDFLEAVNKVIKSYAKFSATPRYMTYN
ncbi:26S proteasome regulatory subunit 7 [Alca torda]